jgi:hypothetical protein
VNCQKWRSKETSRSKKSERSERGKAHMLRERATERVCGEKGWEGGEGASELHGGVLMLLLSRSA